MDFYTEVFQTVVPYTYFTLPYAGKPEIEGSEFYVTGTDEYSVYLVDKLSSHVDITGRNMSMDCHFTSVTIAHYLKENKMTLVGTMRGNRKCIPKEPVEMQNRGGKYIKFVYANEDDIMLTSYVVKNKSGKRNILLLSTMHDDVRCSRDERKTPNTICFYDKAKGSVDVVDMVIGKYNTKYKTRKWTMNAFAYMLDAARTNAHTIFKEIEHDIHTFDFIWQLEMLLVNAHIRRLANPVGLQQTVMCKVLKVAESPKAADVGMQDASDRNRCHICIEEMRGQEKYKENKNKLATVKMSCKDCNNAVCKKHLKYICQKCGQE